MCRYNACYFVHKNRENTKSLRAFKKILVCTAIVIIFEPNIIEIKQPQPKQM
jgi:hypothetical protein